MSSTPDSLSDDDVRQIALIAEILDRSTWDFLQLDAGDLKVIMSKGGAPTGSGAAPGVSVAAPEAPPAATHVVAVLADRPAQARPKEADVQDGTVAIVAPTIGRFYARPEPAAAPFVTLGSEVKPDTTVALVEVMKVFTAVRAGVAGIITELCVEDAQSVEYGQVLFRVRPASAAP